MIVIRIFLLSLFIMGACCCTQRKPIDQLTGAELEHACVNKLTDVIVHDIISPPVASRMYSYATLAYYEALRPAFPQSPSFMAKMNDFQDPGMPEGPIDADFAAATAFLAVSEKLVFSKDSIRTARKQLLTPFNHLDNGLRERSGSWGEKVAGIILHRASRDNYRQTRSMPRYSVFNEPGLWKQTPPDYSDATEPHWQLIRPLFMDSASQCKAGTPNPFDLDKHSPFYLEMMEVYNISKAPTPSQDTIARFWDDNPFVSEHKGHLTYANKKITPVGHWEIITSIICRKANADALTTARAYALTSSAMFDGFISCWEEKYRSRTVRPITVIRETLSSEWNSLLQTPPFPEFTSGHSVVSAAAATVLSGIFGNDFTFTDTSEIKYLGLQRAFGSIREAADEAGISRLYGGIHFRKAIVEGKKQGDKVGQLHLSLLR
jgi:hypothetical protein